jgi:hypothetical protein
MFRFEQQKMRKRIAFSFSFWFISLFFLGNCNLSISSLLFSFCFCCFVRKMTDAVIPPAVLRNLSDKLYEKRKNAALEVSLALSRSLFPIRVFRIRFCISRFWFSIYVGRGNCEVAGGRRGSREDIDSHQFVDQRIHRLSPSQPPQGSSFFFLEKKGMWIIFQFHCFDSIAT